MTAAAEPLSPSGRTLHELFEEQAARTPAASAVVHHGERLTYRELDERANRLAHHLRSLGVGPESVVGLCAARSPQLLVALLGILKAGGAYLPLDPAYPAERLRFMLADSGARLLLTHGNVGAALPQGCVRHLVRLEEDWERIALSSSENLAGVTTPDNLAYVMYTSGSTGRPKGVGVEHRALVNFLSSMAREPGLTAADTLVAVTTLSFDIAGLELYLPLMVGAQVVIASREEAADGRQLLKLLTDSGATVLQATPATWRLLLAAGWEGGRPLRVFCGGEALPRELARQLVERSEEVWNLYGPTETTIWSAAHRVRRVDGPTPIGRPIAHTQLYIVDAEMKRVDGPGELLIGGAGLARGYLNRPDLTADKFIPDPFGNTAGARLYRTGDLARHAADGSIEFLGRIDQQVKVDGMRVEPGEIEDALLCCAGVSEAVVVTRDAVAGGRRMVAYAVAASSPRPSADELRESLQARLPVHMVPAVFVFLDAFPLTPNGKVDRNALPPPEAFTEQCTEYVAPRTATEELLVGIWAEVLHAERVGIHESFFSLGGHSLLATLIATRIAEAKSVSLALRDIIQRPTVAALAAYIDAADGPLAQPRRAAPIPKLQRETTRRRS